MMLIYPAIVIFINLLSPAELPIRANGKDIQGESSQSSLGRENSIECLSYH